MVLDSYVSLLIRFLQVSDSQISTSCLQAWSLVFLVDFGTKMFFFVYLEFRV